MQTPAGGRLHDPRDVLAGLRRTSLFGFKFWLASHSPVQKCLQERGAQSEDGVGRRRDQKFSLSDEAVCVELMPEFPFAGDVRQSATPGTLLG